jgi:hypothetical protein
MKPISSSRLDPMPEDFRDSFSEVERAAILAPERHCAAEAGDPEPASTPVQNALASLSESDLDDLLATVMQVATIRCGRIVAEIHDTIQRHQDDDAISDATFAVLEQLYDEIDDIRVLRIGDW